MATQKYLDKALGPRYEGDVFPAGAENGEAFIYTVSNPKSLYIWDGNPGAGHWIFWGYLRDLSDADKGTAGYAAGGYSGGNLSRIDKIVFTTEVTSSLVNGLAIARGEAAGISSSAAGYASGGYSTFTTIDKMLFSTELSSTLTSARTVDGFNAAGLKASTVGYSVGGQVTGSLTTNHWDKINFSSDSVSSITSTYYIEGTAGVQSAVNGYTIGGGTNFGGEVWYNTTQRLNFSSEMISQIVSLIPVTRVFMSTGLSSNLAGYAVGGQDWHLAVYYTNIDKLSFSSEAISVNASQLAVARSYHAGSSARVSGYIMGGGGASGQLSSIDKLSFFTDVISSIASTLTLARYGPAGFENNA